MSLLSSLKAQFFIVLTLILTSTTTKAYVPSVEGLAKLVTAQHGKGIYQIQQKVFFPDSRYNLQETWYIKDNLLKLQSSYKNTFSIYSTKKKQVWRNSQYFISPIGPYFYQNILLSQNTKFFLKAIKQLGLNQTKSSSHLVRYNQKPQYIINNLEQIHEAKTPVKSGPNIIIGNLRFYIQQILFTSNAFVQTSHYKRYKKNLWLPKNTQVFFNKKSFTISTIKVKNINLYQFNQVKYKASKSTEQSNPAPQGLLEFLKYFR